MPLQDRFSGAFVDALMRGRTAAPEIDPEETALLERGVSPATISRIRQRGWPLSAALQRLTRDGWPVEKLERALAGGLTEPQAPLAPAAPAAPAGPSPAPARPVERRPEERPRSTSRATAQPRAVEEEEEAEVTYTVRDLLNAPPAPKDWWDWFLLDYGLLSLARFLWAGNGYFTMSGVAMVFPEGGWRLFGYALGAVLHLIISKAELLVLDRFRPTYILIALVALIIDSLTTGQGLLAFFAWLRPEWMAGVPSVWEQGAILITALERIQKAGEAAPAWPAYTTTALLLLLAAALIAFFAERLLRRFKAEYQRTMAWRMSGAAARP